MSLYDQHCHSRLSVDSQADPADVVRQAIARGLAGITFTEHYDSHPSEWDICIYDYDRSAADIANLNERFGSEIFIGHGIEICYQPERVDQILTHLRTHSFDLVLLSVHWFAGRALHEKDHWDGLDVAGATRMYFETVLEAVQWVRELAGQGCRPFDILGHLDLVKRYTQRYFNRFDVASCRDLIDEILQNCLELDLALEINTSTWRQSLPEPMPADWVVQRYAELGGRAMSLGSDAHYVEHVGMDLERAAGMLQSHGIESQAVFQGRRRRDLPLV